MGVYLKLLCKLLTYNCLNRHHSLILTMNTIMLMFEIWFKFQRDQKTFLYSSQSLHLSGVYKDTRMIPIYNIPWTTPHCSCFGSRIKQGLTWFSQRGLTQINVWSTQSLTNLYLGSSCNVPPTKKKKERGLHEIVAMAMFETTANKLHQQTFNS